MAQRNTRSLVAHLFRRAGFGLRPDELDHFTKIGIPGSVNYLIDGDGSANPADSQYPTPDLTIYTARVEQLFAADDLSNPANRAALQSETRAALTAIKLVIQTWWINRMLFTTRPLQEKMTLFWHGHFATAISKTPAAQLLHQNVLFRQLALGRFDVLLKAVTQDAAMLNWLDGDQNHKGQPNENLARESMELFTLGPGHYTEQDVRESARALTGWKLKLFTYAPYWVPSLHDEGIKTFLGHTGNLGPNDVVTILAAHPATGHFLARKMFQFFAYDNPGDAVLQPFADTYYHSTYDIKAMMRQILLSDAFYSEQAFQEHIKNPVEFVVGTVRELATPIPPKQMAQAMTAMGQELFNPPNVGGWPGGLTWISADALVERYKFAGLLSSPTYLDIKKLLRQSAARDAAGLIDYLLARFLAIDPAPATRPALIDYAGSGDLPTSVLIDVRIRGLVQLLLASPEYQL